jgi:hypothetical protein
MDDLDQHLNDAVASELRNLTKPQLRATDQDTGRATRTMKEHMLTFINGVERDIVEAEAVRDTIDLRIRDLDKTLASAKTAYAMLVTG